MNSFSSCINSVLSTNEHIFKLSGRVSHFCYVEKRKNFREKLGNCSEIFRNLGKALEVVEKAFDDILKLYHERRCRHSFV